MIGGVACALPPPTMGSRPLQSNLAHPDCHRVEPGGRIALDVEVRRRRGRGHVDGLIGFARWGERKRHDDRRFVERLLVMDFVIDVAEGTEAELQPFAPAATGCTLVTVNEYANPGILTSSRSLPSNVGHTSPMRTAWARRCASHHPVDGTMTQAIHQVGRRVERFHDAGLMHAP